METHLLYLEIGAIFTGITVIGIETYIIFVLKKHVKALEQHMDHLNEHSHIIEGMLKDICDHDLGLHDQNENRLSKSADVKHATAVNKVPTRM